MLLDSQLALDVTYWGEPFCNVAAKTDVAVDLDSTYLGEPFWVEHPTTPPITLTNCPLFFAPGF